MLTQDGIAAKEVLTSLFFVEPRQWRLRKVLQITPLTHDSYRARTSLQFLVPRGLFAAAWARAFRDTPNAPAPPDTGADIVLPIDLLPKYVLLDFSLEGPDGKPLSLLTSGTTSALSIEIFRAFAEELDDVVGDGLTTAQSFFEAHRDVIACLISTGQNEIPKSVARLSRRRPARDAFSRVMSMVYGTAAARGGGDVLDEYGFRERMAERAPALHDAIETVSAMLAFDRSPDARWSPFRNPALLISDFLRLRAVTRPLPEHAGDFIDRSLAFLGAVAALHHADAERFGPLFGFLEKLTYEYVAYARVSVRPDRDFMIKMDQIIPMELRWWERYTGALRHQNYLIALGGSRSSHIEVSCEHPIELEQRPKRSAIVVGSRKLPIETIFSEGSHSTRYHQHFYTNRSAAEVRSAILRHGGARDAFLRLRVYYTVEAGTLYGYRLVSVLALAAAILFARLYDPAELLPGRAQIVSLIPFLSGFLGALSALRPQENVVAIRVRKHKLFVLAMVAAMAAHFLIGLLWPSWPGAFREVVGRIPVVGRLVGEVTK